MTLLSFLREKCPDAPSVKALKRWIEGKQCTINGRVETFSTHRLITHDQIVLTLTQDEQKVVLKPLLLWEDEALAAYDKPAGLVCHPSHFGDRLVHRLDKETSGVILTAKSNPILEKMIHLFQQKKVKKTYLAIVSGIVKKEEGTLISHLAPLRRFQGQTLYGSGPKGQLAETRWKKIGQGPKATLLQCYPITGRTHQLRVHLKEMGHPIMGDYQYGKQFCYPARRHLLHAHQISFPHPQSGDQITITAPLPDDFLEALEALGINRPLA